MIKYNLECECGKKFESWFLSSVEYDDLRKKNFINCIYCNSISVKKTVMAPNLTTKTNKIIQKTKTEKKIKKQLLEFRRFVEKNYNIIKALKHNIELFDLLLTPRSLSQVFYLSRFFSIRSQGL